MVKQVGGLIPCVSVANRLIKYMVKQVGGLLPSVSVANLFKNLHGLHKISADIRISRIYVER